MKNGFYIYEFRKPKLSVIAFLGENCDVVPKGLFDQYKWERDVALDTLERFGIGLGEATPQEIAERENDDRHNNSSNIGSSIVVNYNDEQVVSDLISREILIGAIEKCGEEKIYPQALIKTIKALPSAAEQITETVKTFAGDEWVRVIMCKNCYYKKTKGEGATQYYWCDMLNRAINDENYCFWGRKRG